MKRHGSARNDAVIKQSGYVESNANVVSAKTNKSLNHYKWQSLAQGDEAASAYYGPSYVATYGGTQGLGLLGSMISLVSGLLYLKLPDVTDRIGSRKRAAVMIGLLDALSWLPLIFAFLFYPSMPLFVFIILWVVSLVPAVIISPLVFSWVSDLMPVNRRGQYFGHVTTLGSISYLGSFYAMGYFLGLFQGRMAVGFAVIFGVAFLSQIISWFTYRGMYDAPASATPQEHSGFIDFLKVAKHSNLGKFMVYASMLNFTTYLALPFISVFLLEDLHFSYAVFTTLILSQMLGKILSLELWGRYADRRGNLRVIAIVSVFAPFVPLLLIVSHVPFYIFGVMLFSGVVGAGLDLCSPNFVYEAAPAGRGMKYEAYYKGLTSIAMALGILVGGYLASHIAPVMGHSIQTVFLISGALTLVVVAAVLPKLSEIRPLAHWTPRWSSSRWTPFFRPTGQKRAAAPPLSATQPMPAAAAGGGRGLFQRDGGERRVPVPVAASSEEDTPRKRDKGLFYRQDYRINWGTPVVPGAISEAVSMAKAEKNAGEADSSKRDGPIPAVEKRGLFYRPHHWDFYGRSTSGRMQANLEAS